MTSPRMGTFALAALGVLAAGCGTTVATTGASSTTGGSAEFGAPGSTQTGAPGSSSASAGPGGSFTGPGGGTTGVTGTASGTGPTGIPTTAPTLSSGHHFVQGLGVTPKAVYIGVPYITNGDAANAALGAGGITTGDQKAEVKAIVADINAHGGVAGRKLVAIIVPQNATSQDTKEHMDEVACAHLTQDHKVLAVAGTGVSGEMTDCLDKAGVLQVDSNVIIDPDDAMFRQYPNYFEVGTLSQDVMMADLLTTFRRMHYFTPWDTRLARPGIGKPKIGIISVDVPEWNRPLEHVLLPGLARLGFHVSPNDIARIHNPNSAGEDGQTVAQVQAAALRFASDGVTHVIDLDATGGLMLFFGPTMRGQNYYPRFGITSGSGTQVMFGEHGVTNKQLNGAEGLGWEPSLDLRAEAGNRYATSQTKRCMKLMRNRAGETFDSTNAASFALGYCDQIHLIADAIDAAGPVINEATVRAAIERMGSHFIPSGVPSASFSPQKHFGVDTGFDMAWDGACTCIRYVGRHRIA